MAKTKLLERMYCTRCGSDDVQMKAWVKPNECDAYADECGCKNEESDCWCESCQEHVQLEYIHELYENFLAIPVQNNEITTPFLSFNTSTPVSVVKAWFKKRGITE
jgi:hypothetical protein